MATIADCSIGKPTKLIKLRIGEHELKENGHIFYNVYDMNGVETRLIFWKGQASVGSKLTEGHEHEFGNLRTQRAWTSDCEPESEDIEFVFTKSSYIVGILEERIVKAENALPLVEISGLKKSKSGSGNLFSAEQVVIPTNEIRYVPTGSVITKKPANMIVELRPSASLFQSKLFTTAQHLGKGPILIAVMNLASTPATIPRGCILGSLKFDFAAKVQLVHSSPPQNATVATAAKSSKVLPPAKLSAVKMANIDAVINSVAKLPPALQIAAESPNSTKQPPKVQPKKSGGRKKKPTSTPVVDDEDGESLKSKDSPRSGLPDDYAYPEDPDYDASFINDDEIEDEEEELEELEEEELLDQEEIQIIEPEVSNLNETAAEKPSTSKSALDLIANSDSQKALMPPKGRKRLPVQTNIISPVEFSTPPKLKRQK